MVLVCLWDSLVPLDYLSLCRFFIFFLIIKNLAQLTFFLKFNQKINKFIYARTVYELWYYAFHFFGFFP
jgi:hypothetical protein